MQDLQEHFGTVIVILAGFIAITGTLIGLIWRDLKGTIKEIKEKLGKYPDWESMRVILEEFSHWLKKMSDDHGGLVTRDKFFEWCNKNQRECAACIEVKELADWRQGMSDKGGIVTREEMAQKLENVTDKVMNRITECFDHHRGWVDGKLNTMQASTEKNILQSIVDFRKELKEEKEEERRDKIEAKH
jgi:hypothetical protein